MEHESGRNTRAALAGQAVHWMQKELAEKYRYLNLAIYYLEPEADSEEKTLSTDGKKLYYSVDYVFQKFAEGGKAYLELQYRFLHILSHCLLGHLENRTAPDLQSYDWVADFCAEDFLKGMTGIRRGIRDRQRFREYKRSLEKASEGKTMRGFLNRCVREVTLQKQLEFVGGCLKLDSHERWTPSEGQNQENTSVGDWRMIQNQVMQEYISRRMNGRGKVYGLEAGKGVLEVNAADESLSDYRQLLEELCRLMEQPVEDEEAYDLLWYRTGQILYGGRLILEPSETAEVEHPFHLFVALDTSGSCVHLAPQFLRETIKLLETFTRGRRDFLLWILECDYAIQKETLVTPRDDFPELEKCVMNGWGGTSFVPVFQYIDEKRKNGEVQEVTALLYFTDACGEFPEKEPDYPVYFIIPREEQSFGNGPAQEDFPDVPKWVRKVRLSPKGLEKAEKEEAELWIW